MKIKDVMTPNATHIPPNTTLLSAAVIMRNLNIGVLPVCDDDHVIGIVTDRDLAVRGIASAYDPATTAVRAVMSYDVACVFAGQDALEAARLMEMKQVRRLPVLNQENQLVGIVSLGDLAVLSDPHSAAEVHQMISEPYHA